MDWSPQQADALNAIEEWVHNPTEQVFRLFGYAGTGKSTLAKYIGGMADDDGGKTQYCAFTGKASVVMRRKGCENARTIHSLLYTSHSKSERHLKELTQALEVENKREAPDAAKVRKLTHEIYMEKERLKQPGFELKEDALTVYRWDEESETKTKEGVISLFVVDECSMVDAKLGSDMLSLGAPVLVLGDPAQLPPVGSGGFFTNKKPNILLTDIHRQAKHNPIIQLASKIRAGYDLQLGTYGESRVINKASLDSDDLLAADQILCGRNNTRTAMNAHFRYLLGHEGFLPRPGEKLVCLRNNPEDELLNGSLWECVEGVDFPDEDVFGIRIKSLDTIPGERDVVKTVRAHKSYFMGTKLESWYDRLRANEFDFGYALTVHKSQGSQWDNIILFDDWTMNHRKEWFYTGVTRAAERITVVRK